nr:DNA polymerase IV [Maliibacterium massiliense]
MQRTILHVDMNNFYASVECLHRPTIRHLPVAVGGDVEARHGIILAKNDPAKATGIKTGDAIWQARQKCPGLVVVPPNFALYLRFARLAREIYAGYTDQIEPFGLDEAWLDVTASAPLHGDGRHIADEIRARVKSELGISASVGVSFNKTMAKLGSDMKKPDATTVIPHGALPDIVWPLPAGDLLYVGRATTRKLARLGITTIGGIAQADRALLHALLGKWGDVLWGFARGLDDAPVARADASALVKSIGNSATAPRDLVCGQDVLIFITMLAESVATRLRSHGFVCDTVQISIRNNQLFTIERQQKLPQPTNLSGDIIRAAMDIFRAQYDWAYPIRSLGVRACNLSTAQGNVQLSLFEDAAARARRLLLEQTVDHLRARFGYGCIARATLLRDRPLGSINPKDDHVIYPVSFFKEGGPICNRITPAHTKST